VKQYGADWRVEASTVAANCMHFSTVCNLLLIAEVTGQSAPNSMGIKGKSGVQMGVQSAFQK
jgi:hypothetical protein